MVGEEHQPQTFRAVSATSSSFRRWSSQVMTLPAATEAKKQNQPKFAVCVANEGCDDLQVWKLYRVLPDTAASADGYLRVVDDSGEDYLYPISHFRAI